MKKIKSLGIALESWLHGYFMFSTKLHPLALASDNVINARVVNAREFNSCATKFSIRATKSSKSRWFGATKNFIDYSTKPATRHLEGLTT